MNQLSNLAENMQAESEQLKQIMDQGNQQNLQAIEQSLQGYAEQNQSEIKSFIKSIEQNQEKMDLSYKKSMKSLESEALSRIDSVTNYRIYKTLKFSVAILSIMGVFSAGMGGVSWWMGQSIIEKQATIQSLNNKGGSLQTSKCDGSLCIKMKIDQTYGDGEWLIPEGY